MLTRYDLDETKTLLSKSTPVDSPEIVRSLNEIPRMRVYPRSPCVCLHSAPCGQPNFVLAEGHDSQLFLIVTYGLPRVG